MRQFILFLLVMISFNASAITYSQVEINKLIRDSNVQQSSREFVRGFFTENNPASYINNIFVENKNSKNPILLEYKLYQLLDEVSYRVKQGFLQEFVTQMKTYTSKAFKIHDEGRVPVEIYNIRAKAQGVENIWLASDAFVFYQHSFERDPTVTLLNLKDSLSSLKQPEWFGLKKSIGTISRENRDLIADYLLGDRENLMGLDKFVSHFALITANQKLAKFALQNLNKSSSEYLLRNLKKYFDKSFVIQQLINVVDNNKNVGFAISMMSGYVNDIEVEEMLFSLLANQKHSIQAAMALAQTANEEVIQDLETLFYKSGSEKVKRQIVFMLKMNQMESSRVVLERISRTQESDLQTNKWLGSFKGERK